MVQNRRMTDFIPFNRDQSFLLPHDLKRWLPEDDLAHFVIAAVEWVGLSAFQVKARAGGKARYHPRLMLARESGLLRLGTVLIDGTRIDASASKIRPV